MTNPPVTEEAVEPFAYAYRYPAWPPEGATVIRFGTQGREINGAKPIETIPLYTRAPPVVSEGAIMLEMAAADDEARMWQKRFETLCRAHPIWRTADESGSWGLRDFLAYTAKICALNIHPSPCR